MVNTRKLLPIRMLKSLGTSGQFLVLLHRLWCLTITSIGNTHNFLSGTSLEASGWWISSLSVPEVCSSLFTFSFKMWNISWLPYNARFECSVWRFVLSYNHIVGFRVKYELLTILFKRKNSRMILRTTRNAEKGKFLSRKGI